MKRSYTLPVMAVARQALKRGPFINAGTHWLFGRRRFNPQTINALIETGEAIRIDDRVIAASVLTDALYA